MKLTLTITIHPATWKKMLRLHKEGNVEELNCLILSQWYGSDAALATFEQSILTQLTKESPDA